jgi:hypothetical protein
MGAFKSSGLLFIAEFAIITFLAAVDAILVIIYVDIVLFSASITISVVIARG